MSTPGETGSEREEQLRRTRSVRRGVVAAGATGALGVAIAIGATIHGAGSTNSTTPSTGTTEDQSRPQLATPEEDDDDGGFQAPDDQQLQNQQVPQRGQLAAPGGSTPAQGHSSGS
ncbi:hypothetical protein [Marmoricola sp. URHB0036]|uniref:hypothetical protein n=1 Tax=Marmoricola sp. URHB0036 TaxID=1298863 RepID=UPI000488EF1A|nr:hypothetical protein [Marmoricola sp. URHB0036]